MSRKGGFIGGYDPLAQDPIVYSGKWNLPEQMQAIAAGTWTGLPVGLLYSWGDGDSGKTAQNDLIDRSSPTQVGSLAGWSVVAAGNSVGNAVKPDGTLWGWGQVDTGVGDGLTHSSPVQVGSDQDWATVQSLTTSSRGLKTNGELYGWGVNSQGQLGDGTVIRRSSPVQVGALTSWAQVSSDLHTLAVKTDGTLWAWGDNGNGRLGTNTDQLVDVSSPVQVGADTDWSRVAAGPNFSLAVKTDGTLWSWGRNIFGQLGYGTSADNRSSPVQIGALTNWTLVAASAGGASFAINSSNELYAWGRNLTGELGLNTTISTSSPVQVGSLTNWLDIKSYSNTLASKTDGTLWSWGDDGQGRLGLDQPDTDKSSPVQIGSGSNWGSFDTGSNFGLAVEDVS